MHPLCLVVLSSATSCDEVFSRLVLPAVAHAGFDPFRGPAQPDRIALPEFALVDVTVTNADLQFALGIRAALRPDSTVYIAAANSLSAPPEGTIIYLPGDPASSVPELNKRLNELKRHRPRQLAFHALEQFGDIARLKTDVFRDRIAYDQDLKARLAQARRGPHVRQALAEVENSIDLATADYGAIVDLMLSYRGVKAWNEMISLVERMPYDLARTTLVQEQLAFAVNRKGDWNDAERILTAVIESRGPSSETNSLLGRVYKDRWDETKDPAWLDRAIETYLQGFEADWRDAYPGINAVSLMELRNPPDERRHKLLPLVHYAVVRRLASSKPDYWDYATLLELAVLASDEAGARDAVGKALAAVREVWEPETTLKTLDRMAEARNARGGAEGWLNGVRGELKAKVASFSK